MKNSIDDSAPRSSCRATKGQSTQFTIIGAIVPTKKAMPLWTANNVTDASAEWFRKLSDITVNERHPTRPDRW